MAPKAFISGIVHYRIVILGYLKLDAISPTGQHKLAPAYQETIGIAPAGHAYDK